MERYWFKHNSAKGACWMMEGHLSILEKIVSQKKAEGYQNEFQVDKASLLAMADELHSIIVQEIEEKLSLPDDA